jgi:carboxynorspermidine decarboxylase
MNFHEIPSPCFVLEETKLRQNLAIIRYIRQETGVHIVLALKGFAFWAVFPMLRDYLDGAAASSYYEARLGFEEMKTLSHTYSVAYYPDDFKQMMRFSSHLTFNSLTQFEKYYPSVSSFKKHKISCGLRINPEFSVVKLANNDPSQRGSRLGVDLTQLKGGLPHGIEGILVHCLAESSAFETIELLKLMEIKCAHFIHQLKWINLGGGHLFTQNNYDLIYLIEHLKAFKNKYPHINLIFEPCTAIGLNAGFLRAKVLDIIDNQGVKTLVTDVSFKAHLIQSKELPLNPQIKNAVLNLQNKDNKKLFNYTLRGTINSDNDQLNVYLFEKEMHIGGTIIFENTLNYTMTRSTFFNGVNHPKLGILRENGVFEVVKTFDFGDYKRRLS